MSKRTEYEYLASAVILWVAIWIATAGVLDESAFDAMVPILGGGTFFFVVILPAGLFRRPRQWPTRQVSGEPDERGPSTDGRAFQSADARALCAPVVGPRYRYRL